tara:strand:+ start:4027 stop:4218 length:192 start_codon:yes stop_codon:yes gene_type:complete
MSVDLTNNEDRYATIKVVDTRDNRVYEHKNVPIDHVEMIKMNKSLKVEVISTSNWTHRNKRDR